MNFNLVPIPPGTVYERKIIKHGITKSNKTFLKIKGSYQVICLFKRISMGMNFCACKEL